MNQRVSLFNWGALDLEKVTEMVARKTVAGAGTVLLQAYFKKGALVPVHAHPGEQLIYVLQGAVRVVVGGEEATVREGDVLQVPANVPHQAEALDDTFLLDIRERGEGKK